MKNEKRKMENSKCVSVRILFYQLAFLAKEVIYMLLMAVVNRRSGLTEGILKVYQPVASMSWKGIQIVRNFGKLAHMFSLSSSELRAKMVEFARRFKLTLTLEQRSIWDQFAGTLGSAVDREASDNVSYAKSVIPRRRKLMSGIDAYVAANIQAYKAGIATPLDTPPFGEATPPPPITVALTTFDTMTGTATVTFTDPVLVDTPIVAKARLWALVQGGKNKIHRQLVTHVALPSGGSVTFDELRTGHSWSSPKAKLNTIGKAVLRVQMDTIAQRVAGQAPLIGPGSNVAEIGISKP
ncbi:hypothetical protein HY605_04180 [Candidatus Peregrinibacteria bacterium]|nr:hypothetical protein [Candidatus Peregrinibacteria bacterium]